LGEDVGGTGTFGGRTRTRTRMPCRRGVSTSDSGVPGRCSGFDRFDAFDVLREGLEATKAFDASKAFDGFDGFETADAFDELDGSDACDLCDGMEAEEKSTGWAYSELPTTAGGSTSRASERSWRFSRAPCRQTGTEPVEGAISARFLSGNSLTRAFAFEGENLGIASFGGMLADR
jgi:hypothetical protein